MTANGWADLGGTKRFYFHEEMKNKNTVRILVYSMLILPTNHAINLVINPLLLRELFT